MNDFDNYDIITSFNSKTLNGLIRSAFTPVVVNSETSFPLTFWHYEIAERPLSSPPQVNQTRKTVSIMGSCDLIVNIESVEVVSLYIEGLDDGFGRALMLSISLTQASSPELGQLLVQEREGSDYLAVESVVLNSLIKINLESPTIVVPPLDTVGDSNLLLAEFLNPNSNFYRLFLRIEDTGPDFVGRLDLILRANGFDISAEELLTIELNFSDLMSTITGSSGPAGDDAITNDSLFNLIVAGFSQDELVLGNNGVSAKVGDLIITDDNRLMLGLYLDYYLIRNDIDRNFRLITRLPSQRMLERQPTTFGRLNPLFIGPLSKDWSVVLHSQALLFLTRTNIPSDDVLTEDWYEIDEVRVLSINGSSETIIVQTHVTITNLKDALGDSRGRMIARFLGGKKVRFKFNAEVKLISNNTAPLTVTVQTKIIRDSVEIIGDSFSIIEKAIRLGGIRDSIRGALGIRRRVLLSPNEFLRRGLADREVNGRGFFDRVEQSVPNIGGDINLAEALNLEPQELNVSSNAIGVVYSGITKLPEIPVLNSSYFPPVTGKSNGNPDVFPLVFGPACGYVFESVDELPPNNRAVSETSVINEERFGARSRDLQSMPGIFSDPFGVTESQGARVVVDISTNLDQTLEVIGPGGARDISRMLNTPSGVMQEPASHQREGVAVLDSNYERIYDEIPFNPSPLRIDLQMDLSRVPIDGKSYFPVRILYVRWERPLPSYVIKAIFTDSISSFEAYDRPAVSNASLTTNITLTMDNPIGSISVSLQYDNTAPMVSERNIDAVNRLLIWTDIGKIYLPTYISTRAVLGGVFANPSRLRLEHYSRLQPAVGYIDIINSDESLVSFCGVSFAGDYGGEFDVTHPNGRTIFKNGTRRDLVDNRAQPLFFNFSYRVKVSFMADPGFVNKTIRGELSFITTSGTITVSLFGYHSKGNDGYGIDFDELYNPLLGDG